MKNFLLVPSILSANFCNLGQEIQLILQAGCDLIHFDVMDNHYVPNFTMGPMILRSIQDNGIQVFFDVHLMASPVDAILSLFSNLNIKFITIHPETTNHLDKTIRLIKQMGYGAGVALNPSTPLTCLDYIMEELDLILVMAVNPGFGGQCFLTHIFKKIRHVRRLINQSNKSILLSVDGGINIFNVADIIKAGADVVVVGSSIFKSSDYVHTIQNFKNAVL
ncbi:ribulose-phosphate 3-epimerase [Buchnera aphidicola]|uniref:ribulose-phosphate 3-epimerase n=1 Tax=Buchnera aphidicola TaxID=9 RepID=UPI00094CA1C6|nr:ribulose-phosphate 3-epimerase [Buchnera aphidicola]